MHLPRSYPCSRRSGRIPLAPHLRAPSLRPTSVHRSRSHTGIPPVPSRYSYRRLAQRRSRTPDNAVWRRLCVSIFVDAFLVLRAFVQQRFCQFDASDEFQVLFYLRPVIRVIRIQVFCALDRCFFDSSPFSFVTLLGAAPASLPDATK